MVSVGTENLRELARRKAVRYGWMVLTDVTDIKEDFANQTIIEPIKVGDFEKWLGFSGGNVAITVTGFLRGATRRGDKAAWEMMRNIQALLAHIPSPDAMVEVSGIGIGQIALYFMLTVGVGTFFSEMCGQLSMAIKTMSFEDSSRYKDEYAYAIVFEKLSWGLIQYIIDTIASGVFGMVILPPSVLGEMDNVQTSSPGAIFSSFKEQNSNRYNPIGEDVEVLPDPVSDTNDVGQLTITISDDTYEFPNIPYIYGIKPDIDRTLEWKVIPFLSMFPQSFSFNLGEHFYESVWKIIDYVDEDDVTTYHIRLELKKNGEYIYLGKLTEKMQFIFDKDLSIYISNFKLSFSSDSGMIIHSISGMIADNA